MFFSTAKAAADCVEGGVTEDVVPASVGDELSKIVEEYKSKYPSFDVYPQSENRGWSTALNIGLGKCRNEIVFRMDTDDICYPNRFERILKEYEDNPELELVGSFAAMMYENENIIKPMSVPESQDDIYRKVWTCPFIHLTVSFKKSALLRAGSYNPNPVLVKMIMNFGSVVLSMD